MIIHRIVILKMSVSTANIHSSEEKLSDHLPGVCTLCMENSVEIQLICGHLICKSCLALWILENPECPWCRMKINRFLIGIIPMNLLSAPPETKMCEICLHLLTLPCLFCSSYKNIDNPVPSFNKCDCVKFSCKCSYHRHCIGYIHLKSEDDNVKCPACKK